MSVLSTTTGLFCILAVHFHRLGDGFLVSNLRRAYIGLYLELTQQSVYDNLQMKLSHTCDDGLSCIRIGVCTECRILLRKLCKGFSQLALRSLGLRLDGELDNRLRKFHGL